MLRVYTPIAHNIYKAHSFIEFLVYEVWCKADKTPIEHKLKLNHVLNSLYKNTKLKKFKPEITEIYAVCQKLTNKEKKDFENTFKNNNRIEELCNGIVKPIPLSFLNKNLTKKIVPFFKGLYIGFLSWKVVYENAGEKKSYYDKLNLENKFIECPCCGYGDLKTIYSKGRSAFDHYLPQKHYPLSSTNFNNLVPICTTCNSDEKGEVDVLKIGKPIYYPFAKKHPKIEVKVEIDKKALQKFITPTGKLTNKISKSEIKIDFNIKDDQIESWNRIFNIKARYFGKIADNRISWLDDVRQFYRDPQININTYESAFDKVIQIDSNKHLGFLKSPYLKSLKLNSYLIKAMDEVSGNSIIN